MRPPTFRRHHRPDDRIAAGSAAVAGCPAEESLAVSAAATGDTPSAPLMLEMIAIGVGPRLKVIR